MCVIYKTGQLKIQACSQLMLGLGGRGTPSPQIALQNWGPADIHENGAEVGGCSFRLKDSVKRNEPTMGSFFCPPWKFFICFPGPPTQPQTGASYWWCFSNHALGPLREPCHHRSEVTDVFLMTGQTREENIKVHLSSEKSYYLKLLIIFSHI